MELPRQYLKWDVFISYASEDRETIARPLAHLLDEVGLKVWYDEFSLRVGDSLSKAISMGLRDSRFGIVILSPKFLSKKWTQNELSGLIALETNEEKRILPIWHQVTEEDIKNFNPILADRVALSTEDGIKELSYKIASALGQSFPSIESNNSLDGLWTGLSGRLKLQTFSSVIVGDYDWFGASWAGTIKGSFSGNILKFEWEWTLTKDRGNGFFRRIKAIARGEDAVHLVGAWLYQEDKNSLDDVIQEFNDRLPSDIEYEYLGWPYDFVTWGPKIVHPWAFSMRKPWRG